MLTNDSYTIFISTKNSTERYYRDKSGWVKVSSRGRSFRATPEQVLNHVLPALAGVKPNVTIRVEHHDETSRVRPGPTAPEADPGAGASRSGEEQRQNRPEAG
jgi:hypothetical protein